MRSASPCKIEFNEKLLFPTVSLFVADNRVGRACVSPEGETTALTRLDIFEGEQRKGYGSIIMDYILELCVKKGSHLTIDVDPRRSESDDPLAFYQKYFNKNKIPHAKGHTFSTKFFNCQCSLEVALKDIIAAEYPAFAASGLTEFQFLAMQKLKLTLEQVKKPWFKRDHYVALQEGVPYAELQPIKSSPSIVDCVVQPEMKWPESISSVIDSILRSEPRSQEVTEVFSKSNHLTQTVTAVSKSEAVAMHKKILAIQPRSEESKQLLADYKDNHFLPDLFSTDAIKIASYCEQFIALNELSLSVLPQALQSASPARSSEYRERKPEKAAKTKNQVVGGSSRLFGASHLMDTFTGAEFTAQGNKP